VLRVVDEAARTDTGRQRHANEDAYLARSPVYVVADGMGGAQAGEVASRVAAEAFDSFETPVDKLEEQLAHVARDANRRIFELASADSSRSGMGTTLTGALVGDDEVSIVHVGDSRAYLLREGELRQLTRDHSLVEELRRQGQLTSREAEEHPQRSIITRALGPEPDVELDLQTHQARSGDVFLLCSDGLTSMVREDRLREILTESESLREAVDRLVREANDMGGRDNITVVCFRLGGDGPTTSTSLDETMTDLHGSDVAAAATAVEEAPQVAEPAVEAPPARRDDSQPLVAGDLPDRDRSERRGRRRRTVRRTLVLAVALVALAAALVGANAARRNVYFLGQERGLVTLYRGVPYELPFGIDLYESRYVSSVPVQGLSRLQRQRLLDHQLRSREDAADLVRSLEEGRD
jgi:PPM family protein phosphatase